MKYLHYIRRSVFAVLTLCLLPVMGWADDVVPRGSHEQMKNAGVNIMPRPKAWDDIDTPLTAAVTEANPLKVTLCTSYRSPYAYLGMDRYAALEMDYFVKVDVKYVFPIAIRDPGFFAKASDYRYLYDPHDMARIAKRRGIPYYVDFSGDFWPAVGHAVKSSRRDGRFSSRSLRRSSTSVGARWSMASGRPLAFHRRNTRA